MWQTVIKAEYLLSLLLMLFPHVFNSFKIHKDYTQWSVTVELTGVPCLLLSGRENDSSHKAFLLLLLSHFSHVRPHRRQPTRLPRPWDSPGKNTGVGCHFLLQCRKVKSEREVAESCSTLSDPMDCNLPASSIHGIFQAKYWSGVPLPSPQKLS